jgi:hypothetical protein
MEPEDPFLPLMVAAEHTQLAWDLQKFRGRRA